MRELSQPVITTVEVINLHVDVSTRNQDERCPSDSYEKVTQNWVIGRPMASEQDSDKDRKSNVVKFALIVDDGADSRTLVQQGSNCLRLRNEQLRDTVGRIPDILLSNTNEATH